MDNKSFKVYITIFVIPTVIASCFAVYFAIKLSNKNTENIIVGKVEKNVKKYVIPTIYSSKCLNSTDGYKYYR